MRAHLVAGVLGLAFSVPAAAQQAPPDARRAVEGLRVAPLRFQPPSARRMTLSNGISVYLLRDATLPILDVQIVSRMGVAHLPDSLWGIGWQADAMLRQGGTTRLSPDSVDRLIEFHGLSLGISTGNESSNAFVSGLSRYRDVMLELAFELLRSPRNDTSRIRIIAGQQEENWRRRNDQPGPILARAWSQVVLGDHPLGRSLVTPDEIRGFTPERFRWAQSRIFCPQNLLIGVSGDFEEASLRAKLESLFRGWPRCEAGLREIPPVGYAAGPKVVLVEKDINQTNIRMGHAGGIRVGNTPDYFASQVADFILGGGGFVSRLLKEVRSDSGFAYSVGSSWDADPKREGLFAAGAQVRAEKTVAALKLMRQIIGSMASEPVTAEDVKLAQDYEVNAFVFRFETPGQIVAQQLGYAVDGLPPNWFDVYLRGVQAVTPQQVRAVSERYLKPNGLVTVVVGKSSAFDRPLAEFGEVTVLPVEGIRR